ncbi:MAG: hypothetical protein CMM48_12980 [Rhodospirillaceae bacterium]|nr:hypothetical protein [Rhodospirillaceae bacterium]
MAAAASKRSVIFFPGCFAFGVDLGLGFRVDFRAGLFFVAAFAFLARGLDDFAAAAILAGADFDFFRFAVVTFDFAVLGRAAISASPPDYRGENTAIKHHPVVFYDLTTICCGFSGVSGRSSGVEASLSWRPIVAIVACEFESENRI